MTMSINSMTSRAAGLRVLLTACIAVSLVGCQRGEQAGSADPHHYSAAEARAAYTKHMQAGGPGAAPPHSSVPPGGLSVPGKTK